MTRGARLGALMAMLWAASARGAGVEYPDSGAVGLGRGGAFAANPDTGLALRYNPAGLAEQLGINVDLEGVVAWNRVRFDPGTGASAQNYATPWAFPVGGVVSWGMENIGIFKRLTVAAGVVAPSAAGNLDYPANGPQRYSLISNNLLVAYPTAAVAVRLGKWVSLGFAGQLTFSEVQYKLAARPLTGTSEQFDAVASVKAQGGLQPTWQAGLTVTPASFLALGLSYRPAQTLVADGTLNAQVPGAAGGLNVQQVGNSASVQFTLPQVLRLGVEVKPFAGWHLEADYVYEGWSSFQNLQITPHAIAFTTNQGVSVALPSIAIAENFVDAHSLRLGSQFDVIPERLTVRAGYIYESSAVPTQSISVAFPHWGDQVLTLGATLKVLGVYVDVGYGHYFMSPQKVTASTAMQVTTPALVGPNAPAPVAASIGNGTYQAAVDILALSLRIPFSALFHPPAEGHGGAD